VTDAPPLIVTGMHRSGTSLLASMLVDAGVDLGTDLLAPDHQNRRGYFEDRPFLEFDRRVLAAACPDDDPGWPDWGWTEAELLDPSVIARHEAEGRELLASRRHDRAWGWKDPRATLLLDFWAELAPDARYLFVYRPPWEVADSMVRYGHPALGHHPSFALRTWAYYNRHLLDFADRHPDQCALVSIEALTDRWPEVAKVVTERLGVLLADVPVSGLDPELLVRDATALEDVTRDRAAWAMSLLDELEHAADLPSGIASGAAPAADPVVSIVLPCFNGGIELFEAVASCDRIRDVFCELVIVDDGSDDPETCRLVAELDGLGYRVVRQKNSGLGAARNAGLRVARGHYVLPLDHDNRLRPEYVTRALDVMERDPAVGVVYGDAQRFGARDDRWEMGPFDVERLLRWNHIDACAVVRKRAIEEGGGYDDRMLVPGAEDWDLWLGLAERGWRFHYIPEVLFDYRVRPGSMVTGLDQPGGRREVVAHIVAKHRDLYSEHLPAVVAGLQQWIGELYESATSLEHELAKLTERAAHAEQEAASLRETAAASDAELVRIRATRTWRLRQRLLSLLRRK
jgi:glycosyltransferase involved in cell wall biosynthesis